jgi:hypothetical protein
MSHTEFSSRLIWMLMRPGQWSVGSAVLVCAGVLAAQRGLSPTEQDRALFAMHEYALHYAERLPDYTCLQVTEREHDAIPPFLYILPGFQVNTKGERREAELPNRHWSNVIEEEVSLNGGRASYHVLKIDGRASNLKHDELRSAIGAAEFATILRRILAPDSAATFRWVRTDKLRGRPTFVFSVNAPEANGVTIQDPALGGRAYHVGFTGFVFSDAETQAVMRVSLSFAVPAKATLLEAAPTAPELGDPKLLGLDLKLDVTLDYKPVNLGGRELVLPDRFEVQWHRRLPFAGAGIKTPRGPDEPPEPEEIATHGQFKEYRIASAKSSISFSDDQALPNGEAHSVLTFGAIASPSGSK